MRQKLWKRDANYGGLTWEERDAAFLKILGIFVTNLIRNILYINGLLIDQIFLLNFIRKNLLEIIII